MAVPISITPSLLIGFVIVVAYLGVHEKETTIFLCGWAATCTIMRAWQDLVPPRAGQSGYNPIHVTTHKRGIIILPINMYLILHNPLTPAMSSSVSQTKDVDPSNKYSSTECYLKPYSQTMTRKGALFLEHIFSKGVHEMTPIPTQPRQGLPYMNTNTLRTP